MVEYHLKQTNDYIHFMYCNMDIVLNAVNEMFYIIQCHVIVIISCFIINKLLVHVTVFHHFL